MTKPNLIRASKMATLTYNKNWSKSTLGSVLDWSPEFKIALNLMFGFPMPCAMFWGPEYKMFYNDAFINIAGSKHPECLGKNGANVWPETWEVIGPEFRDVFYSGKTIKKEGFPLPILLNGKMTDKCWDYSLFPVFEGNLIRGIFNPVEDVTEKTTAREKIEEQYRALEAVYEISSLAVARFSAKDFTYLQVNNTLAKIIGIPAEKLIGTCVFDTADDIHGVRNAFDSAIHGNKVQRVVKASFKNDAIIRKFQVEYIPVFNSAGNVDSILTVGVEITEET